MPRGRVMRMACCHPLAEPVASTTQSYAATGRLSQRLDRNARLLRDAQLFFVTSELVHLGSVRVQDLPDQQAKLAVAQNGH